MILTVRVITQGQSEVLGLKVGASEAEPISMVFLRGLSQGGLRGVKLAFSDPLEGDGCKVLNAAWKCCACSSSAMPWRTRHSGTC